MRYTERAATCKIRTSLAAAIEPAINDAVLHNDNPGLAATKRHGCTMGLSAPLAARLAAQPIGLGGAPLGNLFDPVSNAEAEGVIARALATGVRYFDTAPHYGQGLSEIRFGAALHRQARDTYILSTKVGRILEPSASVSINQHGYVDARPFATRYDYSGAGFVRSLADSCQRLRIEYLDFVFVHDLDPVTHGANFKQHFTDMLASGLPTLAAMKAVGTIGGFGIGVNGVDIALKTLREADLDLILLAGRYTLADQSALPELLPECVQRDVQVVLGGPFNSGILATGSVPQDGSVSTFDYVPATPSMISRVAAIEAVCAAHRVPLAAAALQFAAAHPAIAVVLAGARSVAEIESIVAWRQLDIPAAFWEALHALGLIDAAAPFSGRSQ